MNELVLRDIHLPDASLWWPPALGWWILLMVIVLLLIALPSLWRRLRHQSTKKLSRNAFKQIVTDFDQHRDQRQLLVELSNLLRRIMMSYRGRPHTAGMTGPELVKQLDDLVESRCFSKDQCVLLTSGQYAREVDMDCDAMIESFGRWINSLPRRSQHVSA